MYESPKFNFKQFKSKNLASLTLGDLGILGKGVVDFTKYCNQLNEDDKTLIKEHVGIPRIKMWFSS